MFKKISLSLSVLFVGIFLPSLVSAHTITVNLQCTPLNAPGNFNILIDGGAVSSTNLSCGGYYYGYTSTGPITVSAGTHTISQTAGPGTNLSSYTTAFGVDCNSSGQVTVATSNLEQTKTCYVHNTQVAPDGDTTPPAPDAYWGWGLTAYNISNTEVRFYWFRPTDNVAVEYYAIWRTNTNTGGMGFAWLPYDFNVNWYTDSGLEPGQTYSYVIRAVDTSGNMSAWSPPLTVTTTNTPVPDNTPPPTPTGLAIAYTSNNSFGLTWSQIQDGGGEYYSYHIYRNGTYIGSRVTPIFDSVTNPGTPYRGPATTNYFDSGLQPSSTYSYTVDAYDAAGNVSPLSSPYNGTTSAFVDTTAPSTPTGLIATAVSDTETDLSWNASTDDTGVTGYKIFKDFEVTPINTSASNSYSDTGLAPGLTHYYSVSAYDAAGNNSAQTAWVYAQNPLPAQFLIMSTVTGGTKNWWEFTPYYYSYATGLYTYPGYAWNAVQPGLYQVSEIPDPNYTKTYSGDCDASGNMNLSYNDVKFCTMNHTYNVSATATNLANTDTTCSGVAGSGLTYFQWNYSNAQGLNQSKFQLQITTAADSGYASPVVDRTSSGLNNPSSTLNQQSVLVNLNPSADAIVYGSNYIWRVKVWDSNNDSSNWITGPAYTKTGHPDPVAAFNFTPTGPVKNSVVTFTNTSSCYNGSGATSCGSYSWSFGDGGVSSSTSPTHVYTTVGSYTAILQATDDTRTCQTQLSVPVAAPSKLPTQKEVSPF